MNTLDVIDMERLARQLQQVRLQHARIPPATSFYDLPAEIRLVIYELAYRGTELQVHREGWKHKRPSPNVPIRGALVHPGGWKYRRPFPNVPIRGELETYRRLLVDKQYYSEAIVPFYRTAVWHFSDLKNLETFVSSAPSTIRENVQSVNMFDDSDSSNQIWTARVRKDDLPRLENLTIHWEFLPFWRPWMNRPDVGNLHRVFEGDDGITNLLALRGLRTFQLKDTEIHTWFHDLMGGMSDDERRAVFRDLEATIARVVCQREEVDQAEQASTVSMLGDRKYARRK
ncbi:hypothetical protein CLAFUR0_07391 [Fulvia fulva]|nr:hypothetical protein CLAFUR0_07391 [Fulvia fulva]